MFYVARFGVGAWRVCCVQVQVRKNNALTELTVCSRVNWFVEKAADLRRANLHINSVDTAKVPQTQLQCTYTDPKRAKRWLLLTRNGCARSRTQSRRCNCRKRYARSPCIQYAPHTHMHAWAIVGEQQARARAGSTPVSSCRVAAHDGAQGYQFQSRDQ